MNDCRKSDKPIVPGKFSNKLDNVVAERMEGRGMPKENKRQQNMLRTQRRESVLSELHLIHQRESWCYDLREEPYVVITHVRIYAGDVG